ncbi:MAG: FHA domain-containing protein [Acidobacteria bacterium]|nr:FHA domain-containing protein [Acidobacteriota bacterium]
MWILRALGVEPENALTFRLMPGHVKTAGRSSRSDFIIDAPLVSRLHCRFTVSPEGIVELQDLDSTNGTWVNGDRVQRATLAEGAVLTIGRAELMLERDDRGHHS